MKRLLAAAAFGLLLVHEAPGQDLPPAVQAERDQAARDCRDAGGQMAIRPGYVRTADFNGDGVPDYVLDQNQLVCRGAESTFCGTGGCAIEVFISSPAGHRDARLQALGFGASIRGDGASSVLVIAGRGGESAYRWDGRQFVAAGRMPPPRGPEAGPQPGPTPPYGRWVFLEDGRCPEAGQGLVIERDRIVVDWGGDQTTFGGVALVRCEGAVCTFRQARSGRTWSTRTLSFDRIVFRGALGSQVTARVEAQREGPGCKAVQ
ncbi:hypothetical protein [Phreatobacter sp.]|uniref:hypothetical protein n=1 Tax=Phreatobacter sp. TaxID=1966341 RepID=UPI0022C540DB|nr:hypothetical protein [Phreatobacter sp.]MCZ8316990.1 hypothetical protein [Phreatobacter sp.]